MKPNIFLAAFQRTGSTHLAISLCRLLNYRLASTIHIYGGDDSHGISENAARVLFPLPAQVFHQHTQATTGSIVLLDAYGLRPVVMMRSMLDSMVSLRESLNKGPQWIGIYVPKCWDDMPEEEQYDWLARNASSWYFTFYASWASSRLDRLTLWYDEFYADQPAGIKRVLSHVGLDELGAVTDEAILKCTERHADGRFNVGVSGRGRKTIPRSAIDAIYEQANSWGPEWYDMFVRDLIER